MDVIGACRMKRLEHVLFGGFRAGELQVVADGPAHKGVPLRNVDKVCSGAFRNSPDFVF